MGDGTGENRTAAGSVYDAVAPAACVVPPTMQTADDVYDDGEGKFTS